MAIGIERAILLETDGGRLGSGRDGRRDRRRDPGAGGGRRSVRPDPVRQRVGGQRRLPGRRSGSPGRSAGRSSPGRRGSRSATARRPSAARPRAAAGRSFELPLPAVVSVKEGINLPRYPSVPGRLRARKKEIERSTPERRAGRAREDRPPPPAGGGHERDRPRPGRRRGAGRRRPAREDRGPRPVSGPVLALVTLAGDAPDRGSLEVLRLARQAGRRDRRPAGGARRRRCRGRSGGVRSARRIGRHHGARRRPSRPDARPPRRLGGVRRPGRRNPAAGGRRRDRHGAWQRSARAGRRPARPADGGELSLGRAR